MPQFHETGYGRTFFEHQLPELTKAINRLADTLVPPEEKKLKSGLKMTTRMLISTVTELTKDLPDFDHEKLNLMIKLAESSMENIKNPSHKNVHENIDE